MEYENKIILNYKKRLIIWKDFTRFFFIKIWKKYEEHD